MWTKSIKRVLSIITIALMMFMEMSSIMPSIVSAVTTSNTPKLTYKAHVQDYGWMDEISINNKSTNYIGTTGEYKRIEALEINIQAPVEVTLKYRVHVEEYGWMNWVNSDSKKMNNYAGTTGEYKRMEAIQIIAEDLDGYILKYRAHVQDYGWMDWITASKSTDDMTPMIGNYAGTTGESKRMEALEIVLIPIEKEEQPKVEVMPEEKQEQPKVEQQEKVEPKEEPKVEKQEEVKPKEEPKVEKQEEVKPKEEPKVEKQEEVKPQEQPKVEKQEEVKPKEEPKVENKEEIKPQEEPRQEEIPKVELKPEPEPEPEIKNEEVSKDHVHDFTEWTVKVQVTCVTQGLETRTCKTCGKVESKVIQSHELIRAEYNDVEATCEQRGQVHYICRLCKQQFFHYTPMLGHIWADTRVVDKEPTCTEDGYESIHCTREGCTHTKDVKVLEATGHEFETVQTEATCLEDGVIKTVCTKCGDVKESKITQRRLGHNFTNYVDNGDATCTTDGTKTAKCTRCEQESTIINTGSKLNHDYEEIILIPATCTESGRVKKVCRNCGYTKESIVPAKGHEWKVISRNSSCTGSVTETVCEGCGEAKSVTCHTYGTGHKWNEDGTRCTVCNIYAPKWTNSWCSNVFLPTLAKVLKEDGCRTPGTSANDYNSLTSQGRIRLEEELKKADKDYNPHSHIRIVWFVYYTSDLRECEGYDGKANIYRNVITADWKFEQKAPKAKEGYEFTGWVDALSGEKVSDDMLKEDSNGDKTILVNTWRDMDKTFKPTYKKIS